MVILVCLYDGIGIGATRVGWRLGWTRALARHIESVRKRRRRRVISHITRSVLSINVGALKVGRRIALLSYFVRSVKLQPCRAGSKSAYDRIV